jgi:adenine-specific DNA-methyltransferase
MFFQNLQPISQKEISKKFNLSSDVVILCGDVLNELDKLPKKTFDLIITSPPYNIGKSYEDKQSLESYLIWQEAVISKLYTLLSDEGSICWQVGNYIENSEIFPLDIYFYPIFKKFGLQLRNRLIWHFNHGLHASKRFSGRYETLLWFTKQDNYTFNLDDVRVPSKYPGKRHYKGEKKGLLSGNPKGKNPSDFWEIIKTEFEAGILEIPNVKANHPEKTEHPCQFPVELVERCILAITNKEHWVLDPFGGVGSTALAAIKNDRKVVSLDKSDIYSKIAKKRIEDYISGKVKIRPIGTPIFQPTGKEKITKIPQEWIYENSRKI